MVLAVRGRRAEDHAGDAPVQDPSLKRALRRRALAIGLKAMLGAVLLTAAALLP